MAFSPANESNSYILLIEQHQDSLYCEFTEARDEFYSACLTENKLLTQLKPTKEIQADKSKHHCPISPGTEEDRSARLVLTCLYLNINLHSNLLLKAVCIFCMCGGEVGRMCLPLQACLTLCAEGGSAARLQFLMKVKGLQKTGTIWAYISSAFVEVDNEAGLADSTDWLNGPTYPTSTGIKYGQDALTAG